MYLITLKPLFLFGEKIKVNIILLQASNFILGICLKEGERFASALNKTNLNNKIIRLSAKIKLRDYIKNFLINNR